VPIPPFAASGLLPPGEHQCTVEDVLERFGAFRGSDRRQRLSRGLVTYVEEVRGAGIGKYLIVNGSYVTDIDSPNDIDVLLVLKDDVQLDAPVPPFQYNARSKKYVKRNYGLDFFFGFEHEESAQQIVALFQDVKYQPGAVKGILKVVL